MLIAVFAFYANNFYLSIFGWLMLIAVFAFYANNFYLSIFGWLGDWYALNEAANKSS